MSIIVQCQGCQKRYQVGDDRAGTRAKCKVCGTVLEIPALATMEVDGVFPEARFAPAPVRLPPPMASRAVPPPPPFSPQDFPVASVGAYPPAAAATSYAGAYTQRPAKAPKSNTGLIVGIVVGVVALLACIGGVAAFVTHVLPKATFQTDAALQTQLAGRWNLTHSASGPATGSLTFKTDGTYRAHLNIGSTVADFSGPFTVRAHLITLTIATVHFGNHSAVGQLIPLGSIKEVTSTKLVLGTKYGDETYQKR